MFVQFRSDYEAAKRALAQKKARAERREKERAFKQQLRQRSRSRSHSRRNSAVEPRDSSGSMRVTGRGRRLSRASLQNTPSYRRRASTGSVTSVVSAKAPTTVPSLRPVKSSPARKSQRQDFQQMLQEQRRAESKAQESVVFELPKTIGTPGRKRSRSRSRTRSKSKSPASPIAHESLPASVKLQSTRARGSTAPARTDGKSKDNQQQSDATLAECKQQIPRADSSSVQQLRLEVAAAEDEEVSLMTRLSDRSPNRAAESVLEKDLRGFVQSRFSLPIVTGTGQKHQEHQHERHSLATERDLGSGRGSEWKAEGLVRLASDRQLL